MTNDPVLELDDNLRALATERGLLAAEHARREPNAGCPRAVDDAFVAHSEKWHPAMRHLADTPATTLDGVLAKLRIVAGSLVTGRETIYDEDILLLAIADLERMSRAGLSE